MTTQQHPAQFDWATELLDAQGHVTLSAKEANEIGARLRSMGDKLNAYEDLDEAASDVQLLRMGYAAARLFTKKPVTIAAIQWTGHNLREVITFTDGPPDTRTTHAGMAWETYTDLVARDGLKIYTLEGKMLASPGDWIIRGVKGEMYPCKDEIFRMTYEPAALAAGQATAAQQGAAYAALSDAEIDRIVPALEPVSEDFPAEWAVWKDRERIRNELRASHGQAHPTVDDLCARIKAADDAAADRDYMLDSNDCIAVLRGEWKAPLAMDKPERASHGQAPAGLAVPSMSADEVNALPTAARAYIHQLATNTDPAGMVRENMQLRDTNAGLQSMYRKAADAAQEVVGCFHAAECEGLQAALAGTADEHLKDLVERRLMHALYAAQEVAGQAPAQAAPATAAAATVIKKGADRQWMSERLGHLPDGIYSLYLAPPAQPAPQQEARPVTPYTCPKCHALWLHWPAEQSGFGVDTLNCRSATHCDYCEKGGVEQLERLERVPAALKAPQQEAQEPVGYTHASWIAEAKRGGGGSFVGRKNAAFDVPIYTAPQPSPTPQADSVLEDAARLTYEQEHAIRQGHEIAASDGYFDARPQIDSNDRRKVFQAGFERGWDAASKQGANHD